MRSATASRHVRVNADYQALTDAQRDLQDSLLTQKKDLLENITAHFDGLYLAERDAYTEKLARKNAAIVLFRAKQTELPHLSFKRVCPCCIS